MRKLWLGVVIAWILCVALDVTYIIVRTPHPFFAVLHALVMVGISYLFFLWGKRVWRRRPAESSAVVTGEPEKFEHFEQSFHHWHFWHHKPAVPGSRMRWWTKWDAPIIAVIVGLGVPALAWLPVGFCTRLSIAFVWVLLSTSAYWPIELQEILGQIKKYGKLDQNESDAQRRSMYWPYWGVVIAVFVGWFPFAAVWVFMLIASLYGMFAIPGPIWYGPSDWALELVLLLHAGFVLGYLATHNLFPIISRYQEAYASISRLEKETKTEA